MDYINIKQIIDDLLDDDSMKGLTLERAVDYTVEFMRIMGNRKIFTQKTAVVDIEDYRGLLPCDFISMILVRDNCSKICYIASTNNFYDHGINGLTYKILGNVIFTSEKNTKIEISYNSILVDDDGFPLIIDNGTYAKALLLYILKKWFTKLFNQQKLPLQILQNVKQEYAWAVGLAQSDLTRLSIDETESLKNQLCTIILPVNKHREAFGSLNRQERLKF